MMNFAWRYGKIWTRVGAIPDLQRPLALTTRPLVYIRLVPHGFPSHIMENYPVPVVYTRVVEWLMPRAFEDQGLLPLGFECLRISTQNSSQIQSPRGDVSLRIYERVGAPILWCPPHSCTTDCHAGPLDSVHAGPWPRGRFSLCNCNHLPGL